MANSPRVLKSRSTWGGLRTTFILMGIWRGILGRGAGQGGVDSHAGSVQATAPIGQIWDSPRSLLLQLVPWLSSVGHTSSAVPQSTTGPRGCVCVLGHWGRQEVG